MAADENIAAVLLAAGRSRRMGAFKPLLPFGGVTVAEACVASLRAGGAGEVVVVVGHRGGEVRAAAEACYLRARPLDNTDHLMNYRKQMARPFVLRALQELQQQPVGG